MADTETFRCRIYQPESREPWTRSELIHTISVCGRVVCVVAEEWSADYLETHAVGEFETDSKQWLLDTMVAEGSLLSRDYVRAASVGPFGVGPTETVREYTRPPRELR